MKRAACGAVAVCCAVAVGLSLTRPALAQKKLSRRTSINVTVDTAANRHAINPLIYGVAYADDAALADLRAPLHRYGGNNASRYNWLQNADNRGNDWFYQSIADASPTQGERGDSFIARSRAKQAEPMITIPMVGWVGKVNADRSKTWSFSILKYGLQQKSDLQWCPDAGNGVKLNGAFVTGNDSGEANIPADHNFQKPWVQHLVGKWGTAATGGLRYYLYDNEPSIWHSTHRDVHPTGATMEEVRDKIIAYGSIIRTIDPGAKLVGPEEWGWSGYFFSGYDQQWGGTHGWWNLPDRSAHGGKDYLPWLLEQLKLKEATLGFRLLDVFTVHYYPQGGEFGDDVSTAMQLRRNRSTRALWDPNYVDETWIGTQVKLIPRMKEWVNAYYHPGTPVGITEYNWGAEGHMNGATTQADIWGIFGREGLDMAARWTTPATGSPAYLAMKLFRNYDGADNGFGETSVKAITTRNADEFSAFASVRARDGALTLMLINKALPQSGGHATDVGLDLRSFRPGRTAQVWRLASAQQGIRKLSNVAVSHSTLSLAQVPPQSITLVVIPPASAGP